LAHVEAKLARLATAIATGGSLSALLSAFHDREERRIRLNTELAALDGVPFSHFDAVTMENELRSYLVDWPSLAQRHRAQTRQMADPSEAAPASHSRLARGRGRGETLPLPR